MNYIAVRGKGNPNEEGSEYKQSIGLLYGIAFTIKMSKKGSHQIDGYFDYVVPPLEGLCLIGHRRCIEIIRQQLLIRRNRLSLECRCFYSRKG